MHQNSPHFIEDLDFAADTNLQADIYLVTALYPYVYLSGFSALLLPLNRCALTVNTKHVVAKWKKDGLHPTRRPTWEMFFALQPTLLGRLF